MNSDAYKKITRLKDFREDASYPDALAELEFKPSLQERLSQSLKRPTDYERFIGEMRINYHKHGDSMFVSEKQFRWLTP